MGFVGLKLPRFLTYVLAAFLLVLGGGLAVDYFGKPHATLRITTGIEGVTRNGDPVDCLPGIAHLSFEGCEGDALLLLLDEVVIGLRLLELGLSVLAEVMQMEVDELFPIIEALELMVFTRTSGQRVELTATGKTFAEADILQRKIIFGEQLLQRIPLATNIRHVLEERSGSRAPRTRFLRELEDHLSEEEAERVLGVVTDWGRYAEILAYDGDTGTFSLENPGSENLGERP